MLPQKKASAKAGLLFVCWVGWDRLEAGAVWPGSVLHRLAFCGMIWPTSLAPTKSRITKLSKIKHQSPDSAIAAYETMPKPILQPQCPSCGRPENIVWVHGHGQCAHCHMNVMPCCDGETCEAP